MKDILGLIKYLLIILLVITFPIILFYVTFGLYDIEPIKKYTENIPINAFTIFIFGGIQYSLIIFILISYLVIPVFITIKAINDHWSKYLDFFFNSFFLMTLFLILICKGVSIFATGKTINILNFNIDTFYITLPCLFILPVYFIIYMTVILKYPSKEITNAPKFIILLNKIPKWLLFIILAFIYLTNGYIYAIIALTCFSVLLNIRKY